MGEGHNLYRRAAEIKSEEMNRKKDVVSIPPSFFRDLRAEMERYDRLLEEKTRLSAMDRRRILEMRTRLEGLLDDILYHRTRKIFDKLLFAMLHEGEEEVSVRSGYAEEERWLIERLSPLLREYVAMVKRGEIAGVASERRVEPLPEEEKSEETVEEEASGESDAAPHADASALREDENEVLIRILEDVGAIAMHDGSVCHLKKEDILHIPEVYAKPLLAMGSAEEVGTPFLRGDDGDR